jgi:hypothetical protein
VRIAAALILAVSTAAGAQDLPVDQLSWRYDEDWSVLRSTKVQDPPWWLGLKYLPLNRSGSEWISLGVDARLRHEGFRGNNWGSADAPDDGYLWLRFMPHVDAHVGPARVFVQGIASKARGVAGGPGPVDSTGIDLLQGFADVRVPLGRKASLTLRAGRELMALGTQRLVGTRYGTNIPQPFDGGRAILRIGKVKVDAFRLRPVRIGQQDFDDRADPARRLQGIYAPIPLKIGDQAGLDAYLLDYHRRRGVFDVGAAVEQRRTWGTRFFGSAGDWSWDWEAMLQRGRFGSGSIRAWSVATETSRSFPRLPLKPALRLRANVASGDKDRSDHVLNTFNPMFPKAEYFGELSPIGPYNMINVNPAVDLDLGHGFDLGFAGMAYWRQSTRDGVYDIAGNLIRSGERSNARFVGTQEELVLSWQANPALSLTASYSLFQAGRFIKETGPGRTIHMVGLETQYRF